MKITFARSECGYMGVYINGLCVYQYDYPIDSEHLLKLLNIKYESKYVNADHLETIGALPQKLEDVEWDEGYWMISDSIVTVYFVRLSKSKKLREVSHIMMRLGGKFVPLNPSTFMIKEWIYLKQNTN